ncbi:hypothetical protein GNI_006110 [Gregarina niphandrodes]|uniref:Uncharacterized protein n=1 Tax=Gregarina niphandrodes TaxID=110365 RepID=A0A023BDI8_GRENI|nr:hypothetical protein GNI_006110 [Gregarina niphandrodes]EZG87871.1 hypothetical protein GNI_006110 [Gregarina niphandrodes]|eukprot:XP_011128633.1 hypothetical protein GNI_006110 [Gregarina niphandrodes]
MKANKSGCLELSLSVHVLLSGFGNEVGAASCDLVSGSVSPRTSRRPGVNLGPDVTLVVDGESNAIPYGDLKRVQGVVADMIRDYFDQDVKGSAPEIKTVGQSSLDRCMRTLEQRLVTVGSNPGMTFGTSGKRPCCSWQWAGVAGELYERLDRDRMVALLKQCALLVSRPTGMTDQWYLAKILQRCLDSRRIKRLMKNVGVECDEGFECTMLLPDMIMADHFVRFPATNEAGRRVIFSISHVAYWLLRTKGKVGRFRKVLGSGTAGEYHWGRIDDFSIKLTRFLWDLWGAERFGRISQLAKQLLPVEVGASMPETCFFWCFVGAIARTNTPEYQTFCSQIGFVPEGKNRVWVLEDQHKDFVERITRLEKEAGGPPEAITTEELQAPQGVDANVEEAQKYVAEMIQDFCKVEGPSTAPLSTLAEPSLSQIMTIVENILSHGQNITTPSHHGTWRWARVAGALYNRLDRSRILELLDSCQTHFGGREEMTDQWYLTKLLQAFAGRRRAASSSLVDRIMNPDERTFAGMILPDIVMARHFVGLPATTTESDRLTIWTVIHVVSWMIKARSNKISGKQTRYMNAGIDDNSIELAAVLFNLWGPERLQQQYVGAAAKLLGTCAIILVLTPVCNPTRKAENGKYKTKAMRFSDGYRTPIAHIPPGPLPVQQKPLQAHLPVN